MNKKGKMALFISLFLVSVLVLAIVMAGPKATKACRDGKDNDGDGYTDWPNDPGCSSKNDQSELNTAVECDDGADNDGDGSADLNDGGCSSPADNDETNCGDGVCEGGETSGNCQSDCGYPDSCTDTDGGDVINVFGTTSGYHNNILYSSDDYCVDAGSIIEYFCSGDYEQSSQQSCGTDTYGSLYCSAGDTIYKDFTDYFCTAGVCGSDVTPMFQADCDDSDSYGSDYCMNGSVYRDYNDYYCTGGACDYLGTPELVEVCLYGCTDGACDSIPDSCTDTDGGFVVWSQGTVSGYTAGSPYVNADYCTDSTTLVEFYCAGSTAYSSSFNCAGNLTGCASGACY